MIFVLQAALIILVGGLFLAVLAALAKVVVGLFLAVLQISVGFLTLFIGVAC